MRAVWVGTGLLGLVLAVMPARAEAPFGFRLAEAAKAQAGVTLSYDPSYVSLAYPQGDVPLERGVCADVVIRAYRSLGIDLQARVHQDMAANFSLYPRSWGLTRPDSNIDHRRVPNLETYFRRFGRRLAVSSDPADYRAGELVTWRLDGRLPHIGIVSTRRTDDGRRPLMVHNVGMGTTLADVLFAYPLSAHFRYEVS